MCCSYLPCIASFTRHKQLVSCKACHLSFIFFKRSATLICTFLVQYLKCESATCTKSSEWILVKFCGLYGHRPTRKWLDYGDREPSSFILLLFILHHKFLDMDSGTPNGKASVPSSVVFTRWQHYSQLRFEIYDYFQRLQCKKFTAVFSFFSAQCR